MSPDTAAEQLLEVLREAGRLDITYKKFPVERDIRLIYESLLALRCRLENGLRGTPLQHWLPKVTLKPDLVFFYQGAPLANPFHRPLIYKAAKVVFKVVGRSIVYRFSRSGATLEYYPMPIMAGETPADCAVRLVTDEWLKLYRELPAERV
jgi:hypothetical protein